MRNDKYYVTKEGYQELKKEHERFVREEKPEALEQVEEAREMGNLEDNQAYENAREQLNIIEGRIVELEEILENAEVIEEEEVGSDEKAKINIGTKVTVEVQGNEQTFKIVGSVEADPSQGKLSHKSPVGKKLLGLKEGDVVEIKLPHTKLKYKVLKLHL